MQNNIHNYLLLIWKDPSSRRNSTVGKLTRSDKFYFELDLWETDFEDPEETALKIADLRFVLERGFDLKKHVMDYMNSLPLVPGYQEPIRSAFRRYIKFMRTGIGKSERSYKDIYVNALGTDEMVELFCKEVLTYKSR